MRLPAPVAQGSACQPLQGAAEHSTLGRTDPHPTQRRGGAGVDRVRIDACQARPQKCCSTGPQPHSLFLISPCTPSLHQPPTCQTVCAISGFSPNNWGLIHRNRGWVGEGRGKAKRPSNLGCQLHAVASCTLSGHSSQSLYKEPTMFLSCKVRESRQPESSIWFKVMQMEKELRLALRPV